MWADDDELVSADPADGVAFSGRLAEALSRLGQQAVTGRVAVAVVHGLEVVEVDEDQGVALPRVLRRRRDALEQLERCVPVET